MIEYYWYTSNQEPPWHKLVILGDGTRLYGYDTERTDKFIDKYNMRFELTQTWEWMLTN